MALSAEPTRQSNVTKIGAGNHAVRRDDAMNGFASFGFWTCAAVYAAIGLVGVFFLSTQPNIANATDGYGTARLVAQK
jgi:hypothetical protein